MLRKLVVLLGVVSALGIGHPCEAANIALFGDPLYVDTIPIASGGEFESIRASLSSLGHTVTPFTGVTAANWQAALAAADVVVIPELEIADLFTVMPDDAKAVLAGYVLKGNGLVVCGDFNQRSLILLNGMFGFSLASAPISGQTSTLQATATGTAFAGGPSLPNASAVFEVLASSLPPGSAQIYKAAETTVFTTTVGTTGRIVYLGHDWFAGFGAVTPPGWITVLGSAITQVDGAVGKSFRIAMFDDPAFVDAAQEGALLKAALESMGHVVTTFVGTDEPSWSAALSGADILVIAELENNDLAAALPAATKATIQNYVLSGRGLVTNADYASRARTLLNQLFGLALAPGSAAGPYPLNFATAAGTSFAAGPAQLPNVSLVVAVDTASLPAAALSIYGSGTGTTVFAMSRGLGHVVYSGFDWFATTDQTPWFSALNCGLAFASQSVSLAPNAPAVAAGATGQVSADLSGVAGLASGVLRFRAGGDAVFLTAPLVQSGPSNWAATIPGSSLTNKGVQYFIELGDGFGIGTWPPGAPRVLLNLPVTMASQQILSLPASSYRLAGVPLQASNPDPISIFDELGGYDVTNWRYGTFDGTAYREPGNGAANATPGQGFWIISKGSRNIATGGTSTDLGTNVLVTLRPGFNQIANPFAFPVDFADMTLPAGVEANLIAYNGTGYVPNTATLQPGEGYWIKNNNTGNVQIAIPPLGAGVTPAFQSVFARPGTGSRASAVGWCLGLDAFAGGFADCGNLLGSRLGAAEGRDAYDLSEPPAAPERWVRLGFTSHEGGELLADWRPVAADGTSWQVSFASDQAGQPFHIDLATQWALPSGWSVAAFEGSREIALGTPARITGVVGSTTAPRTFTVVVGNSSYLARIRDGAQATVTAFAMAAPFPNPSGGDFAIDLALPRPVEDALVQVFDVRGRLVKTLLAGAASSGVQRVAWDGRTAAGERATAGVYFVKARAGEFSASRKVALLPQAAPER